MTPTGAFPPSKGGSQKPAANKKAATAAKPKGVTKPDNKSKNSSKTKDHTKALRDALSEELESMGSGSKIGNSNPTTPKVQDGASKSGMKGEKSGKSVAKPKKPVGVVTDGESNVASTNTQVSAAKTKKTQIQIQIQASKTTTRKKPTKNTVIAAKSVEMTTEGNQNSSATNSEIGPAKSKTAKNKPQPPKPNTQGDKSKSSNKAAGAILPRRVTETVTPEKPKRAAPKKNVGTKNSAGTKTAASSNKQLPAILPPTSNFKVVIPKGAKSTDQQVAKTASSSKAGALKATVAKPTAKVASVKTTASASVESSTQAPKPPAPRKKSVAKVVALKNREDGKDVPTASSSKSKVAATQNGEGGQDAPEASSSTAKVTEPAASGGEQKTAHAASISSIPANKGKNPEIYGPSSEFKADITAPQLHFPFPQNLTTSPFIQSQPNLAYHIPPPNINNESLLPKPTTKLPTTFPRFPDLSPSIRHRIWKWASLSPSPRTISITKIQQNQKSRLSFTYTQPPSTLNSLSVLKTTSRTPPLLSTSREAFSIASKIFGRVAGEKYGQPDIWFHFGVDTLYVKGLGAWMAMFGLRLHSEEEDKELEFMVENLRYLTLGIPFRAEESENVAMALLGQFPSLRLLMLQMASGTELGGMRVSVNDLGGLQERRVVKGSWTFSREEEMLGQRFGEGLGGLPVVLWRTAKVLNQLAEKEKNGLSIQPPPNKNFEAVQPPQYRRVDLASLLTRR